MYPCAYEYTHGWRGLSLGGSAVDSIQRSDIADFYLLHSAIHLQSHLCQGNLQLFLQMQWAWEIRRLVC